MTTTAVIIDYFIQSVEAGFSKDEARDRAAKMLQGFRKETGKEEYTALCGMIDRLSKI